MSIKKKSLILIHPAVTTTPDLLESVKKDSVFAGSEELDQFLINKLNDSSVTLESEVYDVIYYVTPEKDTEIKFPTKLAYRRIGTGFEERRQVVWFERRV